MKLIAHPFARILPQYRTVYAIGEGKYEKSIVNIANYSLDEDGSMSFTVDLIELYINGNIVKEDYILVNAAFAELKESVCEVVKSKLVEYVESQK